MVKKYIFEMIYNNAKIKYMGLFDKLRGEFIDIIKFLDNTQDTIVYRFERYGNEIKNNAKLRWLAYVNTEFAKKILIKYFEENLK